MNPAVLRVVVVWKLQLQNVEFQAACNIRANICQMNPLNPKVHSLAHGVTRIRRLIEQGIDLGRTITGVDSYRLLEMIAHWLQNIDTQLFQLGNTDFIWNIVLVKIGGGWRIGQFIQIEICRQTIVRQLGNRISLTHNP